MPKRVLVVDDDPAIVKLLLHHLRAAGYDGSGAGGVVEAQHAGGPWDLLVLDLRLPVGSVEQIETTYPDVPVLTMSGSRDLHPMLQKPFLQDDFLAAVESRLGVPI